MQRAFQRIWGWNYSGMSVSRCKYWRRNGFSQQVRAIKLDLNWTSQILTLSVLTVRPWRLWTVWNQLGLGSGLKWNIYVSKLVRLLKKWHVVTREPILFFIICIPFILEYGSQVFSSCSTKLSKRRRTKTIQRRYMLSTFISERTCKINTLCNIHLV